MEIKRVGIQACALSGDRSARAMGLEARVRIELTIEVLQTSALPLGYRAASLAATTRLKLSH